MGDRRRLGNSVFGFAPSMALGLSVDSGFEIVGFRQNVREVVRAEVANWRC